MTVMGGTIVGDKNGERKRFFFGVLDDAGADERF